MFRAIESVVQTHDPLQVLASALVCCLGSALSIWLLMRTQRAHSLPRILKMVMTGVVAGTTVWSTHFIAMLAYEPKMVHGYEPFLTVSSLLVAIVSMSFSIVVTAHARNGFFRLCGGAIFGLGVVAMFYVGMSAYLIPGHIEWNMPIVAVSVAVGAVFGAASAFCVTRRDMRHRWALGTVTMVLTICGVHFVGMAAVILVFDNGIYVAPKQISDGILALLVFSVTGVILLVGLVAVMIEMSLEQEAKGQLRSAALHDPLTGLPNRANLNLKLAAHAKHLAKDKTGRLAVLMIDLDLFKEVNDLHGHAAGDAVLKELADRLRAITGQREFIARSGGDEFVALKSDFRRMEEVTAFAERLRAQIMEPVVHDGASLLVGASVGIATTFEDGLDVEQLIYKADVAMYRAKGLSDSKICRFNVEMDQQSRDRLQLVSDLRQALARDEFHLVYQVQNDLRTLEPVGFEVLLRWDHPERGRVSPAEFIPIAEETGLIRDIGLWVLRTACLEAAQWTQPLSIAVNVAPQQLVQPSFIEHVSDILFESGLQPERLELEVTEASIIDDQVNTLKVMHRLKAMGIRIAMDDFGTGYSSLATLQAFPFDKIKIDRNFVQDVHENEQSAAIVRSTLLLGAALKIPVLAEGVEVKEELSFLQDENCTSVQGFYFGKPMPLKDVHLISNAEPNDDNSPAAQGAGKGAA